MCESRIVTRHTSRHIMQCCFRVAGTCPGLSLCQPGLAWLLWHGPEAALGQVQGGVGRHV